MPQLLAPSRTHVVRTGRTKYYFVVFVLVHEMSKKAAVQMFLAAFLSSGSGSELAKCQASPARLCSHGVQVLRASRLL